LKAQEISRNEFYSKRREDIEITFLIAKNVCDALTTVAIVPEAYEDSDQVIKPFLETGQASMTKQVCNVDCISTELIISMR